MWEPVEGTPGIIYYYLIVANDGHYDEEPRGYVTYSLHCIYPSPQNPEKYTYVYIVTQRIYTIHLLYIDIYYM